MKLIKYLMVGSLSLISLFVVTSCNDNNNDDTTTMGNIYYASPDGKENASGTKEDPLNGRYGLTATRNPGDTVIFAEGVYKIDVPINLMNVGTAANPLTIKAEEGAKVVIDFSAMEFLSTNRGITVSGDYYHISGIDVTGAGDNGMYISGSYNVVEDCEFYANRDTGLQIGRGGSSMVTMDEWPANNLIKNCTSYNNFDNQTGGENADGFAAKLTVGYGNVFDSCIAYRNSDDGWDLFAKQDSGNIGRVILYNCVSFENGYLYEKEAEVDMNDNPITDPAYNTTLGDGIGFKLGGSTMKGDVLMYNCLSFNNRLHGVGDNSNPGVISVYNTTTYNNCAQINVETGEIDPSLDIEAGDTASANFSLARTEDSYNTYNGLLSYANNASLGVDEYRGVVNNSLFNAGSEYRIFDAYTDASSYVESKTGSKYEAGLSDDSFLSVKAPTGLGNPNIHEELRNEDGSINLGDFLVLKDETLSKLNNGSAIGATLNKTSWEEYEHYNLAVDPSLETNEAALMASYLALDLTCDPNAVMQDFKLPTKFNGTEVYWYSSNPDVLEVGSEVIESNSGSKEIVIKVNRPKDNDIKVTLTANLIYHEIYEDPDTLEIIILDTVSTTKTFEVNVKKATPELGEVNIVSEEKVILDQYDYYVEPQVKVLDASNYSGKELVLNEDYTLDTEIMYQVNKTSSKSKVLKVFTTNPGIYTVTYIAKSTLNPNITSSASYTVYVVDPNEKIDIVNYNLSVNRDGYHITGELSNVKATAYVSVSGSPTQDAQTTIAYGTKYTIEDDIIDILGTNDNTSSYYVHMVIENSGKSAYSEPVSLSVSYQRINTRDDFYSLMSGQTPNNSTTIYSLESDLDFTDFVWEVNSSNVEFSGLLNGNGHTISNINISSEDSDDKDRISIINRVTNGTIMNVNFNNINLNSSIGERVGIIGRMYGGYIHNVKVSNINILGYRRIGGLVGHISEGDNYLSQVEVVNDSNYLITGQNTKAGQDIGGLIGFVQNDSDVTSLSVNVSDCYVSTDLGSGENRYTAGVIGRCDDRIAGLTVNITRVVYEGTQKVDNYAGGIINFTTGISKISITNCAANITTIKQGNKLLTCEKNNSSITGRFAINSGDGYTYIDRCYGTLGEYNADSSNDISYGVNATASQFFGPNKEDVEILVQLIEIDMENVWEIVDDNGSFHLSLK